MEVYGQADPPIYDLSNVVGKLTIYQGTLDKLFDERSLWMLAKALDNAEIEVEKVDCWGHCGLLFSIKKEPFLGIISKILQESKS